MTIIGAQPTQAPESSNRLNSNINEIYLSAMQIDSQYLSSNSRTLEEISPNKRQRFQETMLCLDDQSQLFPILHQKNISQPTKIQNLNDINSYALLEASLNNSSFYGLPLKVY